MRWDVPSTRRGWPACAPATSPRRRSYSARPPSTIQATRPSPPTSDSRSAEPAGASRRRRSCAPRSRRTLTATTLTPTWPICWPRIRRAGSGATRSSPSWTRGWRRSRTIARGTSTCCSGSPGSSGRWDGPPPRGPACSRSSGPTRRRSRARSASGCSISSTGSRSMSTRRRSPTGHRRRSMAATASAPPGPPRCSATAGSNRRCRSSTRSAPAIRAPPRSASGGRKRWRRWGASTRRRAIWRSRSTWRRQTRRPGARSAVCSPRTAARWSSIAPTRRCAKRSRWSQPGPTCASCARRSPEGAPPSARPPSAARRRRSTRALSTCRPKSGSTSAIRSAWGAISSRRRWPIRPASSPRRCRSTRSAAPSRRPPSTRSTTTARGYGPSPPACASWERPARRPRHWSAPGSTARSSSTSRRHGSRERWRGRRRGIGPVRWPISSPTWRGSRTPSTWRRHARCAQAWTAHRPSRAGPRTPYSFHRCSWPASACSRIVRRRPAGRWEGLARPGCRPIGWWRSAWWKSTTSCGARRATATPSRRRRPRMTISR